LILSYRQEHRSPLSILTIHYLQNSISAHPTHLSILPLLSTATYIK